MFKPKASYTHYVRGELFSALMLFAKEKGLGRVIMGPIDVRLQEQARLIRPDLFFVSQEKWTDEFDVLDGVPDLVIEILEESTYRIDRVVKFISYEQVGVSEYWIVDPKSRTIEVYTLQGKEYTLYGNFVLGEMITSPWLEGFELPTDVIFGHAPSLNGHH